MPAKQKFTLEEITRERWLRGRLDYKLHAGQRLIREKYRASKHQLFVGECARQFGKTYLEVVESLEIAFKKRRAKIKIGTAFQTDLLEFILPAFDAVMEDCPEGLKPRWIGHKSKFIVDETGSEIKLVGLDRKPNGLRGNVIDLIVLDEAGFMSRLDYLYKSVIIPATTHRPDCRILVFSTPPATPAHEFIDYVQKAEHEGSHCKLTIYDNPMVDDLTIERLKRESGGEESSTWKREYLCEHITDANLAIIPEWRDEYIQEVPKDDFYPLYHKYSAMDLGVIRDHTAAIFGFYEYQKARVVIEDEYVVSGPELTTEVLQRNIKEKERELWGEKDPYRRISDNNNPLLLQDLSLLHRLHFIPTDKGRLEEMVNTLKMLVRSGGVVVHPRCKQLIGCLKYGIWDERRDQFARSNIYGHFDALAALIYLVRNLDRVTNPIPYDFKVDQDNQIVFPMKRESSSARTLKEAFGIKR